MEIVNISNPEMEYNFYEGMFYEKILETEKWRADKSAWEEFWRGFWDGFYGLGPSSEVFTQEELDQIDSFAQGEIQTADNASNLIYNVDKLIITSPTEPGRDELLPLFNNNGQIVDLFSGGGDNPGEQEIDWYRVGYLVGEMARALIPHCC